MHLLLSAVMEHKSKHRMGFYTSMLTATKNRQMEDYGAVTMLQGRGKESVEFWQGIVRQTVVLDHRQKWRNMGVAPHGEGQSFISEPHPVMLATSRTSATWTRAIRWRRRAVTVGALDPKLRGMLTDLRKAVSESKDCLLRHLQDDLDEMATYPVNPDELLHHWRWVEGSKFGQPFTGHTQYVKDEGIERDEALLVRSSGSKSSNKVTIIQLMDRKWAWTTSRRAFMGTFPSPR